MVYGQDFFFDSYVWLSRRAMIKMSWYDTWVENSGYSMKEWRQVVAFIIMAMRIISMSCATCMEVTGMRDEGRSTEMNLEHKGQPDLYK